MWMWGRKKQNSKFKSWDYVKIVKNEEELKIKIDKTIGFAFEETPYETLKANTWRVEEVFIEENGEFVAELHGFIDRKDHYTNIAFSDIEKVDDQDKGGHDFWDGVLWKLKWVEIGIDPQTGRMVRYLK